MKKYVYESKRSYQSPEYEPVKLKEYIIFRDKTTQEKFMILDFVNNDQETINTIKFEIEQFTRDGKLIRKGDYIYENFEVKGYKHFVPYGKIAVSENCESIKMNLLSACYETKKWTSGKWEMVENNQVQYLNNSNNRMNGFVLRFTKYGISFPLSISIILFLLFFSISILISIYVLKYDIYRTLF